MTPVSDEVLGRLSRQQHELFDRVRRGKLDPAMVTARVQAIMEERGNKPSTPWWYVSPKDQLARLSALNATFRWGFKNADFPKDVPAFVPRTSSEVLLLATYLPPLGDENCLVRTIRELWAVLLTSRRYGNWDPDRFHTLVGQLTRRSVGREGLWTRPVDYTPGFRWMGFDPVAYPNTSAQHAGVFAGSVRQLLAGPEVLVAMLVFPSWVRSWDGQATPRPKLSALTTAREPGNYDQMPLLVPSVDRSTFHLAFGDASYAEAGTCSPTVREL